MAHPEAILQSAIDPEQRVVAQRPMPGMQPTPTPDWITIDDAYRAQLKEKARLLESKPEVVLQCQPIAKAAAKEVLKEVLLLLGNRQGFSVDGTRVTRPDGQAIFVSENRPLQSISQLVQEDICILQKAGNEHVLTAALLCFPASWSLAEKIGKPLIQIHKPVPEYGPNIAQRVQRLFDGVQVGRPMWRANFLNYTDPSLHHPRSEAEPRQDDHLASKYHRTERQTIWRLPQSNAVAFSIHTSVAESTDT